MQTRGKYNNGHKGKQEANTIANITRNKTKSIIKNITWEIIKNELLQRFLQRVQRKV